MAAVQQAHQDGTHVASLLRITDVEESPERLVIEMPVAPTLANIRGALMGGFVTTLIDIAAGRHAMVAVPDGHSTATLDLNVHFLLPIVIGPARATATTVRTGRRTVVVKVDVEDMGTHRLAATSVVQFIVLEHFSPAPPG